MDEYSLAYYYWFLESTAADGEQCPLSFCWDEFQTNVLVHFNDVDWNSQSSGCFESVPVETDMYPEEPLHIPSVDDKASDHEDLNPGERPRLKGNDGQTGVRFHGGPDTRRRRFMDDVEERRGKLCSALR